MNDNLPSNNRLDRREIVSPTDGGRGPLLCAVAPAGGQAPARERARQFQSAARAWALTWAAIVVAGLLLVLAPTSASAQGKTILIFAPHPDDEALCCAGVIAAAKANGDTVKVVVVTNGDFAGTATGLLRQGESVSATALLGLVESDLIFFGYGDLALRDLFLSSSPTTVIPSPALQVQTYGNRGLGFVDYHTFLHGVPGPYNRETILADFKSAIQNFLPDEIYTTSIIDVHSDHSTTFSFLTEALIDLQKLGLAKVPRVHEMTVHEPCEGCVAYHWPEPVFTPLQQYPLVPNLDTMTAYRWNQIERIPVPPSMQDPIQATNLKDRVIAQYITQGGDNLNSWLHSFVKVSEFFWIRNFPTNQAPLATVTTSSAFDANHAGIKAVDQRISGIPFPNPNAEWVANGELAGAWIRMTWPAAKTISNVVLYDRPNSADNILSGTLSFSDGSMVAVGALPVGGNGTRIAFPSRTVTWVQFTVGTAAGANIGLAEIEVFGKPAGSAVNNPPQIFQGPVPALDAITDVETTTISVVAFDVDDHTLTYNWSTNAGTISGSGASVTFNPPAVAIPAIATITLTITDGNGGSITSSAFVTVNHGASDAISISSLTLNPTIVVNGASSTATVTLNTSAPNGAVLAISSSNALIATVPPTVTVAPGSSTATFTVSSKVAPPSPFVTITGSLGGQSRNAVLTLTPPNLALQSLAVNPATVGGGNSATGTVTLNGPTPIGGVVVTLSSNNPSVASVPTNVTVPQGTASATFTVTTQAPANSVTVTLTASYNGTNVNFPLRVALVVPPNLATLATVSVSSEAAATQQLGIKAADGFVDGSPGDFTKEWATQGQLAGAWIRMTWSSLFVITQVRLYDRPNGADNITSGTLSFSDGTTLPVGTLPNNGAALTVPVASKTVSWVQFTVDTAVGGNIGLAEVAVTGSLAPILSSVTLNPSSLIGGASSTGTVTLSPPALAGGALVTLSSNNAAASVPASVMVAAGMTTADFPIATSAVSVFTLANISASFNATLAADLAINSPELLTLSLNPASVTGGNSSTGTATLSGPAPAGGALVELSFDNPVAPGVEGVFSLAGLPQDGSVDWADLGPEYSSVPSGTITPVTGIAGLNVTISTDTGLPAQVLTNCLSGGNCGWYGNFAPGEALLWMNGTYDGSAGWWAWWAPNGPLTVTFSSPQRGFGFQAMADESGAFSATVCAYNEAETLLGCVPFTGNGASTADGSAAFFGLYDDAGQISNVTIDAGGLLYPHDFAIGRFFVANTRRQMVPASVTVPEGATTVTFPVNTNAVTTNTSANITASYVVTKTANLTINPSVLSTVTLDPVGVIGGVSLMGTATLTGAAPAGGAVVMLSADNAVSTGVQRVTSTTGLPRDGSVTWTDLAPSYTLIPSEIIVPVTGLPDVTMTVTSSNGEPMQVLTNCPSTADCGWDGDFVPAAPLLWPRGTTDGNGVWTGNGPLTLTLSSPQHGLGFNIMADEWGPFTATLCAYNLSETLLGCADFNGDASGFADGSAIYVGLYSDAGDISNFTIDGGGALYPHDFAIGQVFVASSRRMVPPSVTVPAGATSATFPVNTDTVAALTTVTITGDFQVTREATLTVAPTALSAVSLSPASVIGSVSSTGTASLSIPAPVGGAVVTLSSDSAAATVPASVTVPAGATSATFTTTTSVVGVSTSATISASYGGTTKTASLALEPPALVSVSMSPAGVIGSNSSTGTVTISHPAPVGGVVVTLSDDSPSATTPASVTVSAGATTATFSVTTVAVLTTTPVTISATRGNTLTTILTVNPPNPIRVNSGAAVYTDSLGHVWSADTGFTGGTASSVEAGRAIANTVDDVLYRSERFGTSFTYNFTVPAASYLVTLKFAETHYTNSVQSGQRVFNVAINGTPVLTNFDIKFSAGGPNIAVDRTFAVTAGAGSNNVQIEFIHVAGQADLPKVNAIEVVINGL